MMKWFKKFEEAYDDLRLWARLIVGLLDLLISCVFFLACVAAAVWVAKLIWQ